MERPGGIVQGKEQSSTPLCIVYYGISGLQGITYYSKNGESHSQRRQIMLYPSAIYGENIEVSLGAEDR